MRSHRTALPNLHQAIVLITFLLGGIFQAQIHTARQDVMEAERARPSDPWAAEEAMPCSPFLAASNRAWPITSREAALAPSSIALGCRSGLRTVRAKY